MTDQAGDVTTLVQVASEIEAEAIAAALEDRGIRAEAAGGYTAGFRAEAPGMVRILVRTEDLEKAKAALAEIQKDRAELDWSKVDISGDPDGDDSSD